MDGFHRPRSMLPGAPESRAPVYPGLANLFTLPAGADVVWSGFVMAIKVLNPRLCPLQVIFDAGRLGIVLTANSGQRHGNQPWMNP